MCSPLVECPTDHQQDVKHKATQCAHPPHPPLPLSADRFDKGGVLGFKGGPKAYSWTDPRGGKVLKCDFKNPGIEYVQSKNELNVSPPTSVKLNGMIV